MESHYFIFVYMLEIILFEGTVQASLNIYIWHPYFHYLWKKSSQMKDSI